MSCSSNSMLLWAMMPLPFPLPLPPADPPGLPPPPRAVVAVAVLLLVVLAALLPPLLRLQPWSARAWSRGCTCRSRRECCLCRPLVRLSSVMVRVLLLRLALFPEPACHHCSWNIHATLSALATLFSRARSRISISLWFRFRLWCWALGRVAGYIFNFKFGLLLAKPANDFLVSIQQIRNPICQLTVSIPGPLIAGFAPPKCAAPAPSYFPARILRPAFRGALSLLFFRVIPLFALLIDRA